MYLIPGFSLLAASWVWRWCEDPSRHGDWPAKRAVLLFLAVVPLVFYPYGMLKTHAVHDAVNSLALVVALVLAAGAVLRAREWTPESRRRRMLAVLALSGLANVSQMISYRNEPARDFEFCQHARAEHLRTGAPVTAPAGLDRFFTRDYYCKDIPFREEGE
jgi:hypothetical protein